MDSNFRLMYGRIHQVLISFSEGEVTATCCVTIPQTVLNREFGMKSILFEGKSVGDGNKNQAYQLYS